MSTPKVGPFSCECCNPFPHLTNEDCYYPDDPTIAVYYRILREIGTGAAGLYIKRSFWKWFMGKH